MIEFLLIFMLNERVVDQTQRFENINSCLYFARRLNNLGSQIAIQSRNDMSVCDYTLEIPLFFYGCDK